MRLVATREFKYSTRRLLPGDEFEASNRDGRLLVAIRKARPVRTTGTLPAPPPAVAKKIEAATAPVVPPNDPNPPALPPNDPNPPTPPPAASDDVKVLREEYEAVLGRKPFPGWNAQTLRDRIAAAKVSTGG